MEWNWMRKYCGNRAEFWLCSSSLVPIFMFITSFRSFATKFISHSHFALARNERANTFSKWKNIGHKVCGNPKCFRLYFNDFVWLIIILLLAGVLFSPPSFAFFHSIVHDHWWSFRWPVFHSKTIKSIVIYVHSGFSSFNLAWMHLGIKSSWAIFFFNKFILDRAVHRCIVTNALNLLLNESFTTFSILNANGCG